MPDFDQDALYSLPLTVPSFDVGPSRTLRLSALLRWQQEAGERQVRRFHMDWEPLAARGLAFVLTRGWGKVYRLPRVGEEVTLETWSDRVERAQFYRGYRLLDGAGAPLTESFAAFCLVDVVSHRLTRPTPELAARLPTGSRETGCPLPAHLKDLPPLSPAGEWRVRRSSVDLNRHLNNTVYADLLTDFLPEPLREAPIKGYALQYLTEAREGELLTLWYGAREGDHYVEVRAGETRCFVGRISL